MRIMILAVALIFFFLGPTNADPTSPPKIPSAQIDTVREERKPFFLDVRNPDEVQESGSLEGYVNIPLGVLEQRLDELPRDRLILTA